MRVKLPTIPRSVVGYLNTIILVVAFVAIFAFFCSQRASFKSVDNIQLLARQGTIVCLAALGMTYIIILEGIDLSVGSVMAFVAVVVAWVLMQKQPEWATNINQTLSNVVRLSPKDLWIVEAGLSGLLAGALCGFINGIIITKLKVVPFIVTLGSYLIVRGVAKGLAGEQKIDADMTWLNDLLAKKTISNEGQFTKEMFLLFAAVAAFAIIVALANYFIKKIKDRQKAKTVALALRAALILVAVPLVWFVVSFITTAFPIGVWILIVMAVLFSLILRYTRFGRHVVAVGSNEQAARLCGVPVERVKLMVYVLGGLCAGISGLLLFSRLSVGDPTAAMGQELDVIAAVVIGGASLSGGVGSILGSLIGAMIMVTLKAGGTQLGWPNWSQEIITGAIIIASVALDRLRMRREA